MKKLFLPLFLLLIFSCSQAQLKEQADALLQKAIPNNEHGLSVLVAQGDNIIYEKYHGYSENESQNAIDENTIFRIGSVTKQFTAASILKLAESNKLSLDDPLNKYIKDFPRGDEVTIHHLLTHTSGIKSYTDQPDFINTIEEPVSVDDLIEKIKQLGYDFDPGDKWKYNNSAYFILGHIIELQSGMSYEAFLEKHFFKPLGMNNTGIYDNSKSYKNEAIGYMAENGAIKPSLNWDMTWAGGAGNLYSTTHDLLKWNKAVFSGEILEKESIEKALTPVQLNDGSSHPYGYGWAITEYRGLKAIVHTGGLHGFLSVLSYYPEIDASVIVLSNASPPLNVVPGNMAKELTQIFFEEHLEEQEEISMEGAALEKYIGKYEYPGGAIMVVTLNDGQLYAQLTGQPRYEIYPKAEDEFFWKVVDAQVKFYSNENGEITHGMHKQGGMEMKVPKMTEKEEISLPSGLFEKYAGEYSLNGTDVKIWEEEGAYYTQLQGQPKFRMYPMANNRFFMKELAVEVEFGSGEPAESLTIFQAGNEMVAQRK
ncbi:serine hydrolase [Fulvivirga sp. RKSG066]|uniref:serine hydrolase n=1 Tax=Fulvivirga aurantia TaxID=2529383 RepID=UPI0012BBD1B9|nr:serine hydrolase [Fulvivirga aurantia]MTI21955.1 serine hydrolase [Fulvivirga aurantia]